MTICSPLRSHVSLAETTADRDFERTIDVSPEDTSVPVILEGPPRARARVPESMAHLVPAVEKLLEYGSAPAVPSHVIEYVRQFLSRYGTSIGSPTINLMSDGGLQLVWRSLETQVEIEFDPAGDRLVMVESGDDVRAEEFSTGAPSALLSEALRIISHS
jgi:hypothetical protein